MKLKDSGVEYYFAIPLLNKRSISSEFAENLQFAFCSIYYPKDLLSKNQLIYTIKVFDHFSNEITPVDELSGKLLLFGESRFLPMIPTIGEMSWQLIGGISVQRKLLDFPDLKECSLNLKDHPENRIWWTLPSCGINPGEYHTQKYTYSDVMRLEWSEDLGELTLKMRIYIYLLKKESLKANVKHPIKWWQQQIKKILSLEPCAARLSEAELKDLVENYLMDYLGDWG